MFSIRELSYAGSDRLLLEQINLELPAGRLYGIIGHNGSGKSTLIKLLSGENRPSGGRVLLNGVDIHQLPPRQLAQQLAYLPQKLPAAADFLVEELVLLGRFPHRGWLSAPSDADRQIATAAMAQTNVSALATRPVNVLSGGERQRVWLALALAQQATVLLLDEPLAALDIVYQVEVLQLLRRLVDEQGLTVIVIIHDINLAAQYCDDFIALKGGRLLAYDTAAALMNREALYDIFGVHLHLLDHPQGSHKIAFL